LKRARRALTRNRCWLAGRIIRELTPCCVGGLEGDITRIRDDV
jgi:hypothetical protein